MIHHYKYTLLIKFSRYSCVCVFFVVPLWRELQKNALVLYAISNMGHSASRIELVTLPSPFEYDNTEARRWYMKEAILGVYNRHKMRYYYEIKAI